MREIPREEWTGFMDSFSRQHEGWLVTVEVLGREIGAQVEAEGKPLEGITAELKDGSEDLIVVRLPIRVRRHRRDAAGARGQYIVRRELNRDEGRLLSDHRRYLRLTWEKHATVQDACPGRRPLRLDGAVQGIVVGLLRRFHRASSATELSEHKKATGE